MAKAWGTVVAAVVASSIWADAGSAQAVAPKGETKGLALEHTPNSSEGVVKQASVALPSAVTGGAIYFGAWADAPASATARVPVIVFLHGSSGLGVKAIGEWQNWLAGLGFASMAPDSFALADRLTYVSPVGKDVYERIHALRASEIEFALAALRSVPWADPDRLVLAGTSEGAPAVARYGGPEFAARIIFSWSCENNYFVEAHGTRVRVDQPVLNVISSVDPFFSPANAWLGNGNAKGHCGAAFADSKRATIVLIPGAPHTLINLPQARAATREFLDDALKR